MRRTRAALLLSALLIGTASAASAQTSHMHLGVHVLYNTTYQEPGAGVQFSLPIASHLEFYPSIDGVFGTGGNVWQPNLDIKFRALGEKRQWMYVGTGVGFLQQSYAGTHDDHAAWNLFIGFESITGQVHPFVEGRASFSNIDRYQVQAGLNFTLGRAK